MGGRQEENKLKDPVKELLTVPEPAESLSVHKCLLNSNAKWEVICCRELFLEI